MKLQLDEPARTLGQETCTKQRGLHLGTGYSRLQRQVMEGMRLGMQKRTLERESIFTLMEESKRPVGVSAWSFAS